MSRLLLISVLSFIVAPAVGDDFPDIRNTQAAGEHPPSPTEMLDLFELPPGFKVTLFAGEPDVQQPIAFDFDDLGRIWVAENYTYSARGKVDQQMRDRVIILHDKDGDGQHDERKVFWDKGRMLTGLTWGYGGLWILNDGTLSFIPDKDGDDVPDSEPIPMLNGWTKNAGHNVVNGLMWGPDGWLYGRHGITDTSYPGTIDTPKEERAPMNCGIWRFHPVKHTFEIVCHGTTNPWGLDYNEVGDMFMSNNVIGHLWHVIPGAHYQRMFGQDFNPHCYELMGPISDHYHWDNTGKWSQSRDGKADDLGGGHSHCGLMLYYGQNFPKEYRGKAFMCNTHGRCVNVDRIERKGSSYVAKHEPNFLKVNTPWFRGVEIKYGPAGCVYLSDWSDNGECHDHDGVHRTSGRIYRISYGEIRLDLMRENFARDDYTQACFGPTGYRTSPSPNEWHRRRARRRLIEGVPTVPDATADANASALTSQPEAAKLQLSRAFESYALNHVLLLAAAEALDANDCRTALFSEYDSVRVATLNYLADHPGEASALHDALAKLINVEASPRVLLAVLSAVQKFPRLTDEDVRKSKSQPTRYKLANLGNRLTTRILRRIHHLGLLPHDPVLRQMSWYAWISHDKWASIPFTNPELMKWEARYFCESSATGGFERAVSRLHGADTKFPDVLAVQLSGIADAPNGMPPPTDLYSWARFETSLRNHASAKIRNEANRISALIGSEAGLDRMKRIVSDTSFDGPQRSAAIRVLERERGNGTLKLFLNLLNDKAVYVDVCKALAAFDDDPRIPKELLKRWNSLRHGAKEAAADTLCSRKSYAVEFTKAIADGRVNSSILTATLVRQLNALNDESISSVVNEHWGVINETPEALEASIAKWKQDLSDDVLPKADLKNGAAQFKKSCATCHKLYGTGGKIGPDLTGGNRANLDYVLSNIINPSGEVPKQYTVSIVELKSGRVVTGVVVGETEQVINIQTDKELRSLAKSDIEQRTRTSKSLMPNGLLDALKHNEVRDLIAFLRNRR